ncbi:MAG: NHLP bacteriocin system secretion protein [Limisphaerales bacterium]
MEPPSRIFRKAALEKLSSPEQLDQLMHVTSPQGWIALVAVGAVLLTALVWSVVGQIPTQVYGRGILIRKGGVYLVTARADGHVSQIRTNSLIRSNDVVAVVEQPELELKIDQAEATLQKLAEEKQGLLDLQAQEKAIERTSLKLETNTYETMIVDYGEQITSLTEQLALRRGLETSGLIPPAQVLETLNNRYSATHEKMKAEIALKQITANHLQAEEHRYQQVHDIDNQLRQATNDLHYLKKTLDLDSQIRSRYSGIVLEVMVKQGQLITPNTPILSLQTTNEAVEARLFLSPEAAKKVQRGMEVQISPTWIKKEEFGFMKGIVTKVSEFPATPQAMLQVLENPALVTEFSQGGTPFQIEAELLLDRSVPRDYQWSSAKGRELKITSGTLCNCTVVVKKQRPISLVIPLAKGSLGF